MDGVEDEEFSLKWNHHQQVIVTAFDSLLNNGIFTDCTLAAEGKFIQAHRVILSACSPYFAAIFSQQFDKHPIVVLHGIKFEELRDMMDYKGEANVSSYDHLSALLMAAQSLQIKGLSDEGSLEGSKSNQYDDEEEETTNGELLKRQQQDTETINDAVESGQESITLPVNGEIHIQQDNNQLVELLKQQDEDTYHKKYAVMTYGEDKIAFKVNVENDNKLQEECDSSYRPKSTRKRKRRSNVDERNQRSTRTRNKVTMSKTGSTRLLRSKSLYFKETSYETDTKEMGQYASKKLQSDDTGE